MKKRLGLLIALAFFLLSTGYSQEENAVTDDSQQHDIAPEPDLIDGATNPELISDTTAYQLWFAAITADVQDHPEDSQAARRAFLRAAKVNEEDLEKADAVLLHFKTQYAQLLEGYNNDVNSGGQPSIPSLLAERDSLVESIRGELESTVSAESVKNLREHVQLEKRNMKVAKEDQ
jgi:hypothetical protein